MIGDVQYVVAKTNESMITLADAVQFSGPSTGWLVIDVDGSIRATHVSLPTWANQPQNAYPYRRDA